MQIIRIKINNFRGIKSADVLLPQCGVLIGDNNVGKTTIFEALDLVLGPDRLRQQPPIDEHDFFQGQYRNSAILLMDNIVENNVSANAPKIEIEVTIISLTKEQIAKFGEYIEFWDSKNCILHNPSSPEDCDLNNNVSDDQLNLIDSDQVGFPYALRISFQGWYDEEEDDFKGKTYFTRSLTESEKPVEFYKKYKQICGFLYLRSLRTGSRALSLERGSLLDIILRLKEVRPLMWESALSNLSKIDFASDPALGISPILQSINIALKKYVPKEWGSEPHLKISNLTREHLRKFITAFIPTGEGEHAAPFYHQGTGTINMLLLAMLSEIAKDKQNVIFAMEEPEIAIPPYAQKCIVHEVRNLASQMLFTSHSPYILEEFSLEETIILRRNIDGVLAQKTVTLPDSVKLKRYRQEFRTRFCEGLLARRILIAEGATEASAFPAVCRRLAELNPGLYSSLEALGICTVDAGGESNIPSMAQLYRDLGKQTFTVCDKQDNDNNKTLIEQQVDLLFMHEEKGFENMVLKNTTEAALARFAKMLDWPSHLKDKYSNLETQVVSALSDYFAWAKGSWGIADFLMQCNEEEIPQWLRDSCIKLKEKCSLEVVSLSEVNELTHTDVNLELMTNESD